MKTKQFLLGGFEVQDKINGFYGFIERTGYGVSTKGHTDKTMYDRLGEYVDYTPESDSYIALATKTGHDTDQTFYTDAAAEWQILYIKGNTVTLVSSSELNTEGLYLKGIFGFNNLKQVLDGMCEKLYSNDSIGAKAFSFASSIVFDRNEFAVWKANSPLEYQQVMEEKRMNQLEGRELEYNTKDYPEWSRQIPDKLTGLKSPNGHSRQDNYIVSNVPYLEWSILGDRIVAILEEIFGEDPFISRIPESLNGMENAWLADALMSADSDNVAFGAPYQILYASFVVHPDYPVVEDWNWGSGRSIVPVVQIPLNRITFNEGTQGDPHTINY